MLDDQHISHTFVYHDGTDQYDYATGTAKGNYGSVVVAGVTVDVKRGIPPVGTADMAAFKLSANGTLLWKWQVTVICGYRIHHTMQSEVVM